MSRTVCWLLLLPACALRGVLPAEGTARARLSDAIPRTVRCETGSVPIDLENWRAAVARSGLTDVLVDAATLSCRTVVVGARPVVVGSNTPSIITLQQTELELQVELRWSVEHDCLRERWLGVSRWRVMQDKPEDELDELVQQVAAALREAATSAHLDSQVRVACPASL